MANRFAGLTTTDYLGAAKALLPPGRALKAAAASIQEAVLAAIADLLGYFHADVIRLADVESNPYSTDQMLPDFERNWGLPDPCFPIPDNDDQRRHLLVARIGDAGGLNKQQYIDLGTRLGLTVTIEEMRPFSTGSLVGDHVYDERARHCWRMYIPEAATITIMTCCDPCLERLRDWGDRALECAVNARNRPSCNVFFAYQD